MNTNLLEVHEKNKTPPKEIPFHSFPNFLEECLLEKM